MPGMRGGPHGPSIKNPKVYEALRRKGYDKSTAAAISNAMARGRRRRARKRAAERAGLRGYAAWLIAPPAPLIAKRSIVPLDDAPSYFPIDLSKHADADSRLIYAVVSTPAPDRQAGVWRGQPYDGDIVDAGAMRDAIDDYMEWANIRAMHDNRAVGVALDVQTIGDATYLVAKIVDDDAWRKVKAGVYKGVSIGGRVLDARIETLPDGRRVRRITKLHLTEISLVDRPANPDAAILIIKREHAMNESNETTLEALAGVAKQDDAARAVALLQKLRDQAEVDGDLEAASRYSEAILLILGAEMEEESEEAITEAPEGETVAAADRAETMKAGRKIAAKRLAVLKRAWLDYGRVLAEAGDEDALALIRLLEERSPGASEAIERVARAMQEHIQKTLAPIAKALLEVQQDVALLKAQPAPGGPLVRAPVRKSEPAVDQRKIDDLRRLALTETHPARRDQYREELYKLTGERL